MYPNILLALLTTVWAGDISCINFSFFQLPMALSLALSWIILPKDNGLRSCITLVTLITLVCVYKYLYFIKFMRKQDRERAVFTLPGYKLKKNLTNQNYKYFYTQMEEICETSSCVQTIPMSESECKCWCA